MNAIEPNTAVKAGWHERARRFRWRDEWTNVVAIQLLLATLLLRLLWLSQPQGSLVFDESYYVNAARVILALPMPEGATYFDAQPGIDPNKEHLPLAKLAIAGSMRIFGDNALGWRLPSVVFGTAAVGLLFLLVRRLTRRPFVALFAAFIFSFDNLVFVHGRIATLDIFMLAFMLLGLYLYVQNRPWLAGAAIALATLSKFNGILTLAIILSLELCRFALRSDYRKRALRTSADILVLLGSAIVFFMAILWPMDRFWTTYDNPVDHVAYVYNYGVGLRNQGGPKGIESEPWQWLLNEVQIPYFKMDNNVMVDGNVVSSKPVVAFMGAMNPFVIAMLPLALAYLIQAALQKREDFAFLMLSLMGIMYLQPFAAAVLLQRVSYLFYFLPVLPGLCAGIAYFFLDLKLPKSVLLGYVAAVLFGFLALFPFRTLV